MKTNKVDERIVLRLETKEKNKTLSKLIRRNEEDYQETFTYAYRCIFGEHFMNMFNKIHNAVSSDSEYQPSKKCVLDYVDELVLQHYIDCLEEVIDTVTTYNCSVYQALRKIVPEAKIMFHSIDPECRVLLPSIAYNTQKYALQLKKGMVKNTDCKKMRKLNKKELSDCYEVLKQEALIEDYKQFKNSKEHADYQRFKQSKEHSDYCIPDEENEM